MIVCRVDSVQCAKYHREESCGVFSCIHQMWKGFLGVSVTSQALGKPEPSRECRDDGADPIGR